MMQTSSIAGLHASNPGSSTPSTSSLAACLLPDVLVQIFALLHTYEAAKVNRIIATQQLLVGKTRLGWMVVTHVCRHWRHVALECPSLWKNICFDRGSHWADYMLSCAKTTPISVDLDAKIFQEWQIQRISGHASQVRSFVVRAFALSLEAVLLCSVSPFHELERLSLSSIDYGGQAPPCATVPNRVLDNIPHIKHLELRNVLPPWSSNIFSNLITLRLSLRMSERLRVVSGGSYITRSQCLPSLSRIFDILENLPLLRSLVLNHVLPQVLDPERPQYEPGERTISLPHLEELRLGGSLLECTQVIDHIDFPSTASLTMDVTRVVKWELDNKMRNLTGVLLKHISPRGQVQRNISKVLIKIKDEEMVVVVEDASSPMPKFMELTMCFPNSSHFRELLDEIIPAIHFAERAEFSLDIDSSDKLYGRGPSQADWVFILSPENLNKVHTVYLRRPSLFPFCTAVSEAAREPEESWVSSIFQGASQVTFEDVNFRHVEGDHVCDDIITLVEQREEQGIPIDKVTFVRCRGLDGSWLRALGKVLPGQVHWDESTATEQVYIM